MKLLINLCAHDGIVSHYTGVGSMVNRYIRVLQRYLQDTDWEYDVNLITPIYNRNAFGYSALTVKENKIIKNFFIKQIDNGSGGKLNYGTPNNWEILCANTASFINSIDKSKYDKVFTIVNDTPFANLAKWLSFCPNHLFVWIPHSSVKIHLIDSAVENSASYFTDRLVWEQNAIDTINTKSNCYFGAIGSFALKHFIKHYSLKKSKALKIFNGEIIDNNSIDFDSNINKSLNLYCDKNEDIILSFGRAEVYKNLESTMIIGNILKIKTIVIAQSYYKDQPILQKYRDMANICGTKLFIDPPFSFAHYILQNHKGRIIVIVPSKKEVMGLIINEIRKLNKDNILIAANNIDGLKEQITDEFDGILINTDKPKDSANKILSNLNEEKMAYLNYNAQITLKTKYDIYVNMTKFLNNLIKLEKK